MILQKHLVKALGKLALLVFRYFAFADKSLFRWRERLELEVPSYQAWGEQASRVSTQLAAVEFSS